MKKYLFCVIGLLLLVPVAAKKPVAAVEQATTAPSGLVISDGQISRLSVAPSYKKGGYEKYWKWVLTNVKYPAEMEAQKIEGMVMVKIIVETDGSVTVDKVVKSPHEQLTAAVLKVIENSPKWMPGLMLDEETGQDAPVRVSYVIPVEFKVRPQELIDPTTGRFQGQKNLKPYGN